MTAFAIIAGLSLAFYLGLIVVLYRDGRKRHSGKGSIYKVQAGSVAELGPSPAMVYEGPSCARQNAATVLARFAEKSGRGRFKLHPIQSEPAKVITLPTLARDNDDEQYG